MTISRPRRNLVPELSVVVPLFNEQENLGLLHQELTTVLQGQGVGYELVFVNDGSRDGTPGLLEDLVGRDEHLVVIHLSRNFGHQAAVSAGLDHAIGKAVVVMDGDLQDPPELLPQLLEKWRQGAEVVYAIRTQRKENLIKRMGYHLFYRVLRRISDLNIPLDSGDFCLMDRKVVEALKQLPERQRFVRGLRAFVGYRQEPLVYARGARHAGKPKYTFKSLVRLALDGLFSFSSVPLRLVSYLGAGGVLAAGLLTLWVLIDAISNQQTPRGWPSLIIVVLFMGSVQLVSLGIIGEYLHRIFVEVKGRPTYLVREVRKRSKVDEQEERHARAG